MRSPAVGFAIRSAPERDEDRIAAAEQQTIDRREEDTAQVVRGMVRLHADAQNAALALGQIGPDARDAVPALNEALGDSQWAVRRQAALALGRMGAEARAAIPGLPPRSCA